MRDVCPARLSREFRPRPWSIAPWVKQDARDALRGDGGPTNEERAELGWLRSEKPPLNETREIR